VQAAFTLAYLARGQATPYVHRRPAAALPFEDDIAVPFSQPLDLTVEASDNTARVRYYYDWHYIGESTDKENDFLFSWDISQTDLSEGAGVLLTSVAYDNEGLISRPLPQGDVRVVLNDAVTHPGAVSNIVVGEQVPGGIELSWDAADANGTTIIGYAIYATGDYLMSSEGTSATLSGLAPYAQYEITVKAKSSQGGRTPDNIATSVSARTGSAISSLTQNSEGHWELTVDASPVDNELDFYLSTDLQNWTAATDADVSRTDNVWALKVDLSQATQVYARWEFSPKQ
jgi:hypothetical protein